MTKQTKKSGKKQSLGSFLQATNQSESGASWADEMEDGEAYGDLPSQSEDLRAVLNKSGASSSSSSAYRPPRDNQFEQGAEERSSSWSRPSRGGDDHHHHREHREPRQPTVISEDRIPNSAPFVAYIGNLPFDTTKDDLADALERDGDVVITDIILPMDRERQGRIRGHGYLVVQDRESLVNILKFNGRNVLGRDVKLDVTDEATAVRMTTKREDRPQRGGDDRRPPRERSDRPPREQTVADLSDNWRGGGARDAPDIFGRNKRQPREQRERYERPERSDQHGDEGEERQHGERRQRRNDLSFEEKFAMQKKRQQRSDNPFGDRKREKPSNSDLFGSGKPWEETKEIRDRVDKLTADSRPALSGEEASEEQQEKPVSRQSDRKKIDFDNFQTRKNNSGGRGGRGGSSSSRGGGRGGFNNKRDSAPSQEKPQTEKKEETKKPNKSLENAFSALEIEEGADE